MPLLVGAPQVLDCDGGRLRIVARRTFDGDHVMRLIVSGGAWIVLSSYEMLAVALRDGVAVWEGGSARLMFSAPAVKIWVSKMGGSIGGGSFVSAELPVPGARSGISGKLTKCDRAWWGIRGQDWTGGGELAGGGDVVSMDRQWRGWRAIVLSVPLSR